MMLVHEDLTYNILGACYAVHSEMGCGFLEAVYQECLAVELAERGIPFVAQKEMKLAYHGRELGAVYVADFVCYDRIVVELKAASALAPGHRAQVMNYLRASKLEVGLLVNFGGHPKLEYERIVGPAAAPV
jgi:GxxExxY protein